MPRSGAPCCAEFADGLDQAAVAQGRHRVAERADTRHDQALRPGNRLRPVRNLGRLSNSLKRLLDAPKVAHPVVNDDDHSPERPYFGQTTISTRRFFALPVADELDATDR